MYSIGYTTGTFDLTHTGHYELLRKCKTFCKVLIVGLVTDSLGTKQKREPILTFSHRKTTLENCKYVDHVVEFNGSTKEEDYKKLKFNVLFISDEYINTPEYSSFEQNHNNIPVYYFPRTSKVSTSEIYREMITKIIDCSVVNKSSTGENLLSYKYKNNKYVIVKSIGISNREYCNTKNNFNMDPENMPRNWKFKDQRDTIYPNISGVNPSREVEIYKLLNGKEWYPVENIVLKTTSSKGVIYDNTDINNNIVLINEERNLGKFCYWIVQENKGKTLKQMFTQCDINIVYKNIWNIINEMRCMGILHMDLHPNNIIVDNNNDVFIIDFGWCLHRSFEMDENEYTNYNELLKNNFDKIHFGASLVTSGLETEIPSLFK